VTPFSLREVTADPVQRPFLVEHRGLGTPVAEVAVDGQGLLQQVGRGRVITCDPPYRPEVEERAGLAAPVLRAGRIQAAVSHLREALQLAQQSSGQTAALRCLDCCGYLCAATGRAAEAVTVWAALDALVRHEGFFDTAEARDLLDERLAQVRHTLGPARTQAAEERGAAMSLATATAYALMLTDPSPPPGGLGRASWSRSAYVSMGSHHTGERQLLGTFASAGALGGCARLA